MRTIHLLALLLFAALAVSGCSDAKTKAKLTPTSNTPAAEVPAPASPAAPAPAVPGSSATHGTAPAPSGPDLAGDIAALRQALEEPSGVTYQIVVVSDTGGKPVSEYFDNMLAISGMPAADTLLLVVFAGSGNDIRFAMGGVLNRQKITVEDMLGLVRSQYFTEVRKGDPATGLAQLIRTVNRRMAQ